MKNALNVLALLLAAGVAAAAGSSDALEQAALLANVSLRMTENP